MQGRPAIKADSGRHHWEHHQIRIPLLHGKMTDGQAEDNRRAAEDRLVADQFGPVDIALAGADQQRVCLVSTGVDTRPGRDAVRERDGAGSDLKRVQSLVETGRRGLRGASDRQEEQRSDEFHVTARSGVQL